MVDGESMTWKFGLLEAVEKTCFVRITTMPHFYFMGLKGFRFFPTDLHIGSTRSHLKTSYLQCVEDLDCSLPHLV
jgi:hypothetical protein